MEEMMLFFAPNYKDKDSQSIRIGLFSSPHRLLARIVL
jgi:hypothetical protein